MRLAQDRSLGSRDAYARSGPVPSARPFFARLSPQIHASVLEGRRQRPGRSELLCHALGRDVLRREWTLRVPGANHRHQLTPPDGVRHDAADEPDRVLIRPGIDPAVLGVAPLVTCPLAPASSQRPAGPARGAAHGEQVCDPVRILDVALAPGDIANVHRICQGELDRAVEHVPHRLPVDARRFHRRMRATVGTEPIRQLQQSARRRRERLVVVLHRPPRRQPHTRDHRRRVDIQPRASLMQDFHHRLPLRRWRGVPRLRNLQDALTGRTGVAIRGSLYGGRNTGVDLPGQTVTRALGTNCRPTSVPSPLYSMPVS